MIQDPLSVNVSGVFFFGMFHHLSGENYPVAYTSNVSVCVMLRIPLIYNCNFLLKKTNHWNGYLLYLLFII